MLTLSPLDAGYVEMRENYLCLTAEFGEPCDIQIVVSAPDGQMVYARNYGTCTSPFVSENIYLRLTGASADYLVSLQAGDRETQYQIHRVQPMLYDNTACSGGLRLRSISGADSWLTATILDLNALPVTVPLYAGNAYQLGTVTYYRTGSVLMAQIDTRPDAEAIVTSGTMSVALTDVDAGLLGSNLFHGPVSSFNSGVDTGDAPYAAVLLTLSVSFNPETVSTAPISELPGQEQLWQLMQQFTDSESNG